MWVSAKSDRRAGELGLVIAECAVYFIFFNDFDLMLKIKIKNIYYFNIL